MCTIFLHFFLTTQCFNSNLLQKDGAPNICFNPALHVLQQWIEIFYKDSTSFLTIASSNNLLTFTVQVTFSSQMSNGWVKWWIWKPSVPPCRAPESSVGCDGLCGSKAYLWRICVHLPHRQWCTIGNVSFMQQNGCTDVPHTMCLLFPPVEVACCRVSVVHVWMFSENVGMFLDRLGWLVEGIQRVLQERCMNALVLWRIFL